MLLKEKRQRLCLLALCVGAFAVALFVTFRLFAQSPLDPDTNLAAEEVADGLNRLSPFLDYAVFDVLRETTYTYTRSEQNSDGDQFPNLQEFDFGTDEDGVGGIIRIVDQGDTLKYECMNFSKGGEVWSGWLTVPDTEAFPGGDYAWDFTFQTASGTEHWQGQITLIPQTEDQANVCGTTVKTGPQGTTQMVFSADNPLIVDSSNSAFLVGGKGAFTLTKPDGTVKEGTWELTGAGTSSLWMDGNANGLVDEGEVMSVNYNSATGKWEVQLTQSADSAF